MKRVPEPEVMDDTLEVAAYAETDFSDVNRRCARRALRAAGRDRGHAIDLGTGPADIPILFCSLAPRWRVTAVDASGAMLAVARRNVKSSGLGGRITLRRGNVTRLASVRKPFDLVFSNSLLHHLEDPAPFWREVRRLTRPGGAVMIQDLFRPSTRREARRLSRLHAADASKLLRELFYQSLLAAFEPEEVREQLRQVGIQGLSVRRISDRHLAVSGRLP